MCIRDRCIARNAIGSASVVKTLTAIALGSRTPVAGTNHVTSPVFRGTTVTPWLVVDTCFENCAHFVMPKDEKSSRTFVGVGGASLTGREPPIPERCGVRQCLVV